MKKLLAAAVAVLMAGSAGAGLITVNFDTAGNWTAGSGALTSYMSDHVYSEADLVFTGGPALRQTTSAQDGFAGAQGTYAWRLRDATTVSWTATYTAALAAGESINQFGIDARRWDGSPSPAYTVSYSTNGGTDWTTATSIGSTGVLDNAAFGNTSDWSSFSQSVTTSTGLEANQFVVRLAATAGERVMVDNFSMNVIPEPASFGLIAGFGALLALRRRRG